MKNLKILIISLMCIIFIGSCGIKAEPKSIKEFYKDGYAYLFLTYDEKEMKLLFGNDDETTYYKVVADMSEKLLEEYESFDIFDEDYEEKHQEFLEKLNVKSVENYSNKKPSQDDLDIYVGKKISELVKDGFDNTGHSCGETECQFFYNNGKYEVVIEANNGTKFDTDNLTDEVLEKAEISSISFSSFDTGILD